MWVLRLGMVVAAPAVVRAGAVMALVVAAVLLVVDGCADLVALVALVAFSLFSWSLSSLLSSLFLFWFFLLLFLFLFLSQLHSVAMLIHVNLVVAVVAVDVGQLCLNMDVVECC